MAFVRKALSFRHRGRYNVQEAKENRFPSHSDSSYKRMTAEESEESAESEETIKKEVEETVRLRRGASDSSIKVAKALRDTFGTIREKMRSSMRRRKRLNSRPNTPASTLRRSIRIRNYTPREANVVESPKSVRLNRFQPKRCNFSSPGQLQTDIDSVSQGIQSLANTGREMDRKIQRQNRHSEMEGQEWYKSFEWRRRYHWKSRVVYGSREALI